MPLHLLGITSATTTGNGRKLSRLTSSKPAFYRARSELPSPSFGDESGDDDLSVPPPPSLPEEPAENLPDETSSQDLAPLPPSVADDLPPSPPAPKKHRSLRL